MLSEKSGELIKAATRASLVYANTHYPGILVASPVMDKVIDRFVSRPKQILIEELSRPELANISEEQAVSIFPMVHRYLETAKAGETEENLRILAEFIANEFKEATPDPSAFTRAARALEGISPTSLKLLSATYKLIKEGPSKGNDALDVLGMKLEDARDVVEASVLAAELKGKMQIQDQEIMEALADFASRGLVYATPNSDFNRPDPYAYLPTELGLEIIDKARRTLSEAVPSSSA